jgi:hypothetical protein
MENADVLVALSDSDEHVSPDVHQANSETLTLASVEENQNTPDGSLNVL